MDNQTIHIDEPIGLASPHRRFWLFGGLGVAIALAIGLVALALAFIARAEESAAQSPAAPPPAEVGVISVIEEPVLLTTELPGRVVAREVSAVRPQVDGVIRERLFEEGAHVDQGELLYVIEDAPYRAAVSVAKGELAKAEATISSTRRRADRTEKFFRTRAISEQASEKASSDAEQAEADVLAKRGMLETARVNQEFTRIRAPISAKIGRSLATVGALVSAGQADALFVIAGIDEVYVDVSQSANDLLNLRDNYESGDFDRKDGSGAEVHLILPNGRAHGTVGKLRFSETVVDSTTGAVTLRTLFPNPDGRLLPGMLVRTILSEGTRQRAILVPQQAVSRDQEGKGVALIVDAENRVVKRSVSERSNTVLS